MKPDALQRSATFIFRNIQRAERVSLLTERRSFILAAFAINISLFQSENKILQGALQKLVARAAYDLIHELTRNSMNRPKRRQVGALQKLVARAASNLIHETCTT